MKTIIANTCGKFTSDSCFFALEQRQKRSNHDFSRPLALTAVDTSDNQPTRPAADVTTSQKEKNLPTHSPTSRYR